MKNSVTLRYVSSVGSFGTSVCCGCLSRKCKDCGYEVFVESVVHIFNVTVFVFLFYTVLWKSRNCRR